MTHPHGGPDAMGVPRWDFSTNANACGPSPMALAAVRQADAAHYPDPQHTALREALAGFHGVAVERIVIAASASEFIGRISASVARAGGQRAWWPTPAYGDYAHAAQAWGLQRANEPAQADLLWLCEPSSPLGSAEAMASAVAQRGGVVVIDRAYEPLRLSGRCSLAADALDRTWQLWTPNKALGLTGVRGAYAIAPVQRQELTRVLERLAPSWPLGAHGVAMLRAWVRADTQQWLTESLESLRDWKAQQQALLAGLGWTCLPSEANYFCARAPAALDTPALRAQGIKLRDTTSLGLPDHWRLGVLPPAAQAALRHALQSTPLRCVEVSA
ncbi:aminotransferase class I/II-fold pyridoxal phosphate-dependent enzyme [Hydrogenophaga sp.]|uniref:aminotransferase class I/II-fold pyridoxal phosphate-dependent enzyme n=1 Tax=Hydrogenophaga sp. TaxID=1904254 RepID=UPI0027286DDC|nr:aminotransferase class I/II-fold pyridoxal phosphate-dependent enzyme [Hydrogenophaga sp.]MDO9251809.1 aminotransferase class I/II-fold pyridoxal phosphate-dependent enzyme [Hydrogenophaga sp.]MDP3322030.1 aminotransferase class I/II-fold pyridoxal phosphate-dependent enzyme [Hydrogenophaga sp.]MDP3884743.1 aminotransferase class I/II-fold pyridoxal phosphate-dependent enzyme [Hydrogenophaga sp.]